MLTHECMHDKQREQQAEVASGYCCYPQAFGHQLMGLFGMSVLLRAE